MAHYCSWHCRLEAKSFAIRNDIFQAYKNNPLLSTGTYFCEYNFFVCVKTGARFVISI